MKLVALYKTPADIEAFEAEYANHVKLVDAIPGLESVRITRFKKNFGGPHDCYLMAEMIFPDKETFNTALRSPEMGATGKDAARFAKDILTTLVATEE